MKAKYIVLVLFPLSLLLFACEKNGPSDPPDTDTCTFFPEGWFGDITIIWQGRTYDFYAPCFNPNNSNEFVYVKRKGPDLDGLQLRKHNLITGLDELVSPITSYSFKTTWNQNDWIFFNNTTYSIWKIKSNGQGLQQITFGNGYFRPAARPSGDFIIAEYLSNQLYTIILNENGDVLDTISTVSDDYAWINDTSLIVFFPDHSFKVYAYPGLDTLYEGTMTHGLIGLEYLNNNRVIFQGGGQLYSFNYLTGQELPIIEKCGNRFSYDSFSISPEKNKILVARPHTEHVDSVFNGNYYQQVYYGDMDIILLDLITGESKVIPLPQ